MNHERVAEKQRTSRRTMADALAALSAAGQFSDTDRATILVGPLKLACGRIVGVIQILFVNGAGTTLIVSLPTASHFLGAPDGTATREEFEISKLNGASVFGDGNVILTDGDRLRGVEVVPTELIDPPSELDWRIVHLTVSIIGAEKRCYRRLTDKPPGRFRQRKTYKIPRSVRNSLRDKRFLDCSALVGLEIPPLKVLAGQLGQQDWTLKKISRQKVADSLRKFGMRIPVPKPRRRAA